MFNPEKPIKTEVEDRLGRKKFSRHLGNALLNWEESESLIIAVYGEWGSGKSSAINLAREYIEKSDHTNKPTVIEFNPWQFSGTENLGVYFFDEIAQELRIKKDTEKDEKLANKLSYYASVLGAVSDERLTIGFWKKLVAPIAILGISLSSLMNWAISEMGVVIAGVGIFLSVIWLFQVLFSWGAEIYNKKAIYLAKSASEMKKSIKKVLADRGKKLLVVIDDIDRLNQAEIRQIFKLVRVNADFPNTIYLLAFDQNIVQANLEEQVGISGADYLSKIVQVNFHLPLAKQSKIEKIFFDKLDIVTVPL